MLNSPAVLTRSHEGEAGEHGLRPTRPRFFSSAAARESLPYLLVVVGYVLVVTACLPSPIPDPLTKVARVLRLFAGLSVLCVLALITLLRWRLRHRHRPGGPMGDREAWRAVGRELRSYAELRVLGGALTAAFALPAFFSVFSEAKRAIPRWHPYTMDPALAEVDRVLHFGRHPWEILHPILSSPLAVRFLDGIYEAWYVVVLGVFVWQAWSRDRALRAQFLTAFFLTWALLGSALATLFASGGPVYYGRMTQLPDPYAPLFAHLRSLPQPPMALHLQDALWQAHVRPVDTLAAGIAAMPSLHVAMTVLLAIVGCRTHRVLGIALVGFALATQVGSVYLGWHYAIDGYLSILLVPLIWWAAGRFVNWYAARTGAFGQVGTSIGVAQAQHVTRLTDHTPATKNVRGINLLPRLSRALHRREAKIT